MRMALAVVDIASFVEDTLDQVIEIIASAMGSAFSGCGHTNARVFSASHSAGDRTPGARWSGGSG